MKDALIQLLKVKTIVTLLMTVALIVLLLGDFEPSKELLSLYCTSYGAVMAYYFTRKDGDT